MTPQEQYRIKESMGFFTIQKKRFIKQFRMFRPSKIVEQWEDVDWLGNFNTTKFYPYWSRKEA